MQFKTLTVGDQTIHCAIEGPSDTDKPVILCVHGWPELWYSWRHQMTYFSKLGYKVVAMDVRGYGGSSKPEDIQAYTLSELSSDVAGVAAQISDEPVILFGHDWGAPIVYATALLHPDSIQAVAGLSVPFMPHGEDSSLALWEAIYSDNFFYQLYFQQEGVVEQEVEADWKTALRKIYFALSGDAPLNEWIKARPNTESLLQSLVDPQPFPDWMSEQDLQVYIDAFESGGFRGPVNRYRAQVYDPEQMISVRGQKLKQPSCFIGGERDAVRNFIPGMDLYGAVDEALEDCRLNTLVANAGHWVQQEAPDAVNQHLASFLNTLN